MSTANPIRLSGIQCVLAGLVAVVGLAASLQAQREIAWSSGKIEKSQSFDTRVFRVIERQSGNSQERFWIHRQTNEWNFEFSHFVDFSSFKTAGETRTAIDEEDSRYKLTHREKGKTTFSIPRGQMDELTGLLRKYEQWVAVAKQQDLSDGIEKELGKIGNLQFKFRTPDRVIVGDWWLDPTCITNFERLMGTLNEMDAEAAEKLKGEEAARIAEASLATQRAEAEAKKRLDEERAKLLLK